MKLDGKRWLVNDRAAFAALLVTALVGGTACDPAAAEVLGRAARAQGNGRDGDGRAPRPEQGKPACSAEPAASGPRRAVPTSTSASVAYDGARNLVLAGTFAGTIELGGQRVSCDDAADAKGGGRERNGIYLAKIGIDGRALWAKRVGTLNGSLAVDIAVDQATGEIALTGAFQGKAQIGSHALVGRGEAILLAKFDSAGAVLSAVVIGAAVAQPSCTHSTCTAGGPLTASCGTCVARICSLDSYCCTTAWDEVCVEAAKNICGERCGCAHDTCTTGRPLDATSCGPCAARICSLDPYCCTTAWDSICVSAAIDLCGATCPCSHDKHVQGAALQPTCDTCVARICSLDSYCCDVAWDGACVAAAQNLCP